MKSSDFVNEGLEKSYPRAYLVSSLQKMIPNVHVGRKLTSDVITLWLPNPVDNYDIDGLTRQAMRCGWYIGAQTEQDGMTRFALHAKYGTDVTPHILKKFQYLYHITPSKNVKRIMQIGLSPRAHNKLATHPERVYLTISPESAIDLIPQMIKSTNCREWTVLQIDSKALTRVYPDPDFDYGIYTVNNIPSTAIRIIKGYDMNSSGSPEPGPRHNMDNEK